VSDAVQRWRFTEWSQRELSDMDGRPKGVRERARGNQMPYKEIKRSFAIPRVQARSRRGQLK
jgi:hypothetical protein